jgi:hypothetical protein
MLYRFTIYPFGSAVVLAWREYIAADFLQHCDAWAANGCAFDVEFTQS